MHEIFELVRSVELAKLPKTYIFIGAKQAFKTDF
jgi:hypothetical protein